MNPLLCKLERFCERCATGVMVFAVLYFVLHIIHAFVKGEFARFIP